MKGPLAETSRDQLHLSGVELHPWARFVLVLGIITGGLLVLARLFQPDTSLQDALLIAFLVGVVGAAAVVRPLGRVPHLARNLDATTDLDIFLACAVFSWLTVRFALGLSGFPQVGGNGLHVAHMLWGGALMLAGTVISLLYIGRYRQRVAAIVAGLGFGLFIDELGKFITSNNDYFYRPAVALIYAVFVALYLSFRVLQPPRHASDRENLINALDWLKEAVMRDHDAHALQRVRFYLERMAPGSEDRAELERLLDDILVRPPSEPGWYERVRRAGLALHDRVIRTLWFERVVVSVMVGLVVIQVVTDVLEARSLFGSGPAYHLPGSHQALTLYTGTGVIVETLAGAVADSLLLAGIVVMVRSRSAAFRLWKLGIQIVMFVAGVISLYYFQFMALPELGGDLVGLVLVNSLMAAERRCKAVEVVPVRQAEELSGDPEPQPMLKG